MSDDINTPEDFADKLRRTATKTNVVSLMQQQEELPLYEAEMASDTLFNDGAITFSTDEERKQFAEAVGYTITREFHSITDPDDRIVAAEIAEDLWVYLNGKAAHIPAGSILIERHIREPRALGLFKRHITDVSIIPAGELECRYDGLKLVSEDASFNFNHDAMIESIPRLDSVADDIDDIEQPLDAPLSPDDDKIKDEKKSNESSRSKGGGFFLGLNINMVERAKKAPKTPKSKGLWSKAACVQSDVQVDRTVGVFNKLTEDCQKNVAIYHDYCKKTGVQALNEAEFTKALAKDNALKAHHDRVIKSTRRLQEFVHQDVRNAYKAVDNGKTSLFAAERFKAGTERAYSALDNLRKQHGKLKILSGGKLQELSGRLGRLMEVLGNAVNALTSLFSRNKGMRPA